MAWNEPGKGNGPDKDPWTGKPKPTTPPDLDQILRNIRTKLSQVFGNGGKRPPSPFGLNKGFSFKVNKTTVGIALGTLATLWVATGIFIVAPAEQAVIVRFGQYLDTVGPGPHWAPRLIDSVFIIDEQKIANFSYTAQLLTSDQNLAAVSIAVKYRITKPRDYLFNVVNPVESLKLATSSTLRQVIGSTTLTEVLGAEREKIRQRVQEELNQLLARNPSGLTVTDVALLSAQAPEEVKEAFDEASRAQKDAQHSIDLAQSYALQIAPGAKSQAQHLVSAAKAYQQEIILRAKADTAQFNALLPSYQKAPGVMRDRLYLDTLENVLSHTPKILLDSNSNNMFYLPLDKLMPSTPLKSTATPATTTPATSADSFVASALNTNVAGAEKVQNTGLWQGGYSQ